MGVVQPGLLSTYLGPCHRLPSGCKDEGASASQVEVLPKEAVYCSFMYSSRGRCVSRTTALIGWSPSYIGWVGVWTSSKLWLLAGLRKRTGVADRLADLWWSELP